MARKLRCCDRCGRDTTGVLCVECAGLPNYSEQRGRRARSTKILGGSPLKDCHDEHERQSAAMKYHGETYRDDI